MSFPDRAPLAPLGIGIGIVGHRPDRLVDQDTIRLTLARLLAVIGQSMESASAGGVSAQMRLVSALAEGADRIAADVALARGIPLVAVLPFPAEVFERDFADADSCAAFRRLVAAAETKVVLDGTSASPERAYDRAGLVLLDNVDLLFAVWDGGPGRGRGGTREVIEEAARRGVPVVTISTDGLQVAIRSGGPDATSRRFADLPALPEEKLEKIVGDIVAPPEGKGEDADQAWLSKLPTYGITHGAYPALLRLAGARSASGDDTSAPSSADPLDRAFQWWDQAAVQAAQGFRSAVIVNFSLAALAVVLAAASVLAGHWKWVFVLLEVVTILLLLANTSLGRKRNWQVRWMESREVAELLRVAAIQRQLSIGRIANAADRGWAGHYVAAFTRAVPLPSVDMSDPASAGHKVIAEVRRQAEWNAGTATRMHRAAHRIERFGEALFGIVLGAALVWLVLYAALPEVATALKYPLTAISAGLPAVATSSYGIRVIIDFQGIAERSHRIADGLNRLLERIEATVPDSDALQAFCRAASATMMSDLASWRLLAEGRRLAIPG